MTAEEKNQKNLARYYANKERYSKVRKQYHIKNREKINTLKREWMINNPEKVKNNHLLRHFGITFERYKEILSSQNGVCAICEKPETATNKKSGKIQDLSVDHNHSNGQVRGLLCTRCNKAIGLLNDSTLLLDRAKEYLGK